MKVKTQNRYGTVNRAVTLAWRGHTIQIPVGLRVVGIHDPASELGIWWIVAEPAALFGLGSQEFAEAVRYGITIPYGIITMDPDQPDS